MNAVVPKESSFEDFQTNPHQPCMQS